ncbi:hypothetical protein KDK_50120 [Dictyobacter kobayashii]|uniref:Signal transduction histidine kinase subgroup 3 dimerisation and phosphoacceptor domain-containing protein n=1 Tax=Dictyobacter kobayashii TaxID=2014872 RepID=A0A402AQ40_9CHLR|nr:hypothetical protein KDK_50120 [Dictyobacter kobayashii]
MQALSQRIEQLAEQARLGNEYRARLRQQASEEATQEERNRIARDLHDSIKQQIFSMSISAAAARAHARAGHLAPEAMEAIEDIQQTAREAQVEMQALLQQLRPVALEHTTLREALRMQAEALGYRTGHRFTLRSVSYRAPTCCRAQCKKLYFAWYRRRWPISRATPGPTRSG